MNTGTGVFVLRDAQTLVAMQAASFATEDDFQRLLASFVVLNAAGEAGPPEAATFPWLHLRAILAALQLRSADRCRD